MESENGFIYGQNYFSGIENPEAFDLDSGRESPAYGDSETASTRSTSTRRTDSRRSRKGRGGALFCCTAAKVTERRLFNA